MSGATTMVESYSSIRRGPDVRDRSVLAHADDGTWTTAWPPNGGNVGPCKEAETCRALRVLGAAPVTAPGA